MEETKQFALLIDSDNISAKYIKNIFEELDKYGFASYRRIYGNWSKANGWDEKILLEYSINPIQQFSYTTGKNATDMAMVIDAMDILYKDRVEGFCLVTSDSDFTRLAMRLREEHKYVLGMGEEKTPIALAKACNKFIHLNLISEQEKDEKEQLDKNESNIATVTSKKEIENAILDILNEKEKVSLGEIGSKLDEKFSDFDVRNYGYTKLNVLISQEMPGFVLSNNETTYYIEKNEKIDKEVLQKDILAIIKRHGGAVDNLSCINDEIKKTHKYFDLKDYGYSRISSFLRSFEELEVEGNKVKIVKKR